MANLSLQERLEETLKQLEQGINDNADQQAKIQAAALQMNRSGWYTGLKSGMFILCKAIPAAMNAQNTILLGHFLPGSGFSCQGQKYCTLAPLE